MFVEQRCLVFILALQIFVKAAWVLHSALRPSSIPGVWDLSVDCASSKARAVLAGLYVF